MANHASTRVRREYQMSNFVAYYRVSTEDTGQSGLDLEAQREAVLRFAGRRPSANTPRSSQAAAIKTVPS